MGLINLYNSVSNEHQEIKANGKISDVLPEIDYDKSVILKAGNRIDRDYVILDDDVIYIRVTPSAITTVVATTLAIGVVVAGGIVLGKAIGNFVDGKVKSAQEKAQKDAQNLAQQINQLPFIKGANNQSALGNAIQYIIGDVYNTPYKLTDGFYTITGDRGSKQFYNIILSLGFGNLQIKDILLGTTPLLSNAGGISSGEHNFDSDSIYYDAENKIEICQKGEQFTNDYFKQKVISTSDGSEIKHDYGEDAEPLIRELSPYTQKVEVCIQFNGLREYDTTHSNWKARLATIRPYWSNDNGVSWNEFYFEGMENNSITLNTNKTIRYVASKTFSASEAYGKDIKIKIVKDTPKLESNSNEECYLAYYQSYCYDNAKSSASKLVACAPVENELVNKTTRIALRILANDNTSELLDEIHANVCALAKTWNGSSWSENKTATRNPASAILEILTSEAHAHSKYLESEIDMASLGALYEYCNTNEFYTDAIITQGIKKRDLISAILNTVNSVMIINPDGLLEFVTDKAESTPVALLNAEDISNITYSKDLSRKPEGLKVTFTNRESWQIDTFYMMLNGKERTAESILTETNLEYVTTYKHAYKIIQKRLKEQNLQPRELSVDVGMEGDYYPLFSTVLLQFQNFRVGLQSSVITGLVYNGSNIKGVIISDLVKFETGKRYGVIIQAQSNEGKRHIYMEVEGTGETRTLNFKTLLDAGIAPAVSNILSFGELDDNGNFTKITNVMKITNIAPRENGFTLTLRDYNSAIYVDGEIPEYKSNITPPPKESKEIPKYERLEGEAGANGYNAFTISLFKRYASTPAVPSGTLSYNFQTGTLSGDLEGWYFGAIPPIDEDNNPCYEIHKTLSTQEPSVNITEWDSAPTIVIKDSNLSLADVEKLISNVTPPPTVSADILFGGFAVDDNGISLVNQSITSEIIVNQANEELGFEFGEINLPSGFEYSILENKITITCKKGTLVQSGNFIIPIKYRAYKTNAVYISNEDNRAQYLSAGNILGNYENVEDIPSSPADDSIINYIGDEVGTARAIDETFEPNTAYIYKNGAWQKYDFIPYGYFIYEDDITTFNLGIGYTQVKGARYLGSMESVANIPATKIIGDYFTWNGADTSSALVEGGVFKQCCIYLWNNEKWELDTSTAHNTTAIFDVLKIANSELTQNNSTATEFLNRLCANQAFIKTLVVTGSAFVTELQALNIYANKIEIAKNEAINTASTDATEKANNAKSGAISDIENEIGIADLVDKTIIDGGTVKTNLINTRSLIIGDTTLGNELDGKATTGEVNQAKSDAISTASADATQKANDAKSGAVTSIEEEIGIDSIVSEDRTIIKNGFIDTKFIEAESIDAEKIDVDSLKATEGFFDSITSDNGTFTNVKVTGTVNATDGKFEGDIDNKVLNVKKANLIYTEYNGLVKDCPFFTVVSEWYEHDNAYYCDAIYSIYTERHGYLIQTCSIRKDADGGDDFAQYGELQTVRINGFYLKDGYANEIYFNGIPDMREEDFNRFLKKGQIYIDEDGFLKVSE